MISTENGMYFINRIVFDLGIWKCQIRLRVALSINNEKINQRLENGLTSAFNHHIKRDENGQALLEKSKPIKRHPMKRNLGARIFGVGNIQRESDQKNDTCMSASRKVSSGIYNRSSTSHQNTVATSREADANPKSSFTRSKRPQNDAYWIEVLGLKNTDKCLLQGSYWLNDRLINAAMTLMRNETYEKNIGGLQDVIIAEDQGFRCSDSGQGFVQIVHVRGNQWVTVSNLLNTPGITCVYNNSLWEAGWPHG